MPREEAAMGTGTGTGTGMMGMTGTCGPIGTSVRRSSTMWLLVAVMTTSSSTIGCSLPFCAAAVEAFCCASHRSPRISSARIPTRARSRRTTATSKRIGRMTAATTTELPLAFFLPDEDRQLRKEDEETDNAATKESLVGKPEETKQSVESTAAATPEKKDNNAMAFLKRMGRVGGAANKNFVNAVGSDEGSTGRQPPAARGTGPAAKSRAAFRECTATGVVDDLSEPFPGTSSGSAWRGVTDRAAVPGGASNGQLRRERDLGGRAANVLVGRVRAPNGGGDPSGTEGFLQAVTDLALDPARDAVDASGYDGIEVDVLYRCGDGGAGGQGEGEGEGVFHLHVRAPGPLRGASYRHTFALERADAWETVRVPFSGLRQRATAAGDGESDRALDPSAIKRIGLVARGRERDVFLAMGGLRFYSVI